MATATHASNTHPQLRADWQRPAVPDGFDELICVEYLDGSFELDFVNNTRRDFASETLEIDIPSPWVDGFKPEPSDWHAIGIDRLVE